MIQIDECATRRVLSFSTLFFIELLVSNTNLSFLLDVTVDMLIQFSLVDFNSFLSLVIRYLG